MSKVFIEEETLIGIGNAIREKNGTTDLIATTDMATAISNLPSGGGELKYGIVNGNGGALTQSKSITIDVSPLVGTEDTTPFTIFFQLPFSGSSSTTIDFCYYYNGAGTFTAVHQQSTSKCPSSLTITEGKITVNANSTMYFSYWVGTGKVCFVSWCE